MALIKLRRNSRNQLYAGAVMIETEQILGLASIYFDGDFSERNLYRRIAYKAKKLGARAYEFCGGTLKDCTGEFRGNYKFHFLDEPTLEKIRKGGQLELTLT